MTIRPAFLPWALVLIAAVAGCSPQPVADGIPAQSASPSGPSPTPTTALPNVDHIVIIVEENKPASRMLGNSEAPFFNELARRSAVAGNYSAITHPSLPNYIALTSGTTAGITSDCSPTECPADVRSIADSLRDSNLSWKMYGEGMPEPCAAADAGAYATKHIPFLHYSDMAGDAERCAAHVVPFTELAADLRDGTLPAVSFVSPDLCNDMHDCPIATGDAWLAQQVPAILESPAFTSSRSLLVVTFDEGSSEDNHVATIFAGSAARAGFTSPEAYTHYSLLHTVEALFDLPSLTDNDRGAAVMTDMLAR